MAKLSAIENNKKKMLMITHKTVSRGELKKIIMDKSSSFEDRISAVHKLSEKPRNSSKVRYRNRCEVTGRPRSFYRYFKMSRIALREHASSGLLPGVTKASW